MVGRSYLASSPYRLVKIFASSNPREFTSTKSCARSRDSELHGRVLLTVKAVIGRVRDVSHDDWAAFVKAIPGQLIVGAVWTIGWVLCAPS